jgi:phage-related protein
MKRVEFVGSSLDDVSAFPIEARRVVGHELWQIQNGLMPSDFKPMAIIGPGAYEIRVHVMGEWRVIYVAKFDDTVFVLHAFRKKTQVTSRQDIEVARQRYREIGK